MKPAFNTYQTFYKFGVFLSAATQVLPTLYTIFSKTHYPSVHEESSFQVPSYVSTGMYVLGGLCLLKACSSVLSSCAEDIKKIFSETQTEKNTRGTSGNPVIYNMVFSGATSCAPPVTNQFSLNLSKEAKEILKKLEESSHLKSAGVSF